MNEKRPGFMMLEVMICMMLVAFASLFTVKLVSEKIDLLKETQTEYELIQELKNTLFLKLITPNDKNLPNRLFTTHSSKIYTTPYEINPKSALKQFAQITKLLSVAYQPNKHAAAEQKLIGIIAYTKSEDE
jgi:hypothetical protein